MWVFTDTDESRAQNKMHFDITGLSKILISFQALCQVFQILHSFSVRFDVFSDLILAVRFFVIFAHDVL